MKMMSRKMKRVSKIGKKASVFGGTKVKTVGGLQKSDVKKNKFGKIVSKRRSDFGKRQFKRIAGWVSAVKKARSALNIKGMVPVNGKTAQGKALYAKAKSFYKRG